MSLINSERKTVGDGIAAEKPWHMEPAAQTTHLRSGHDASALRFSLRSKKCC